MGERKRNYVLTGKSVEDSFFPEKEQGRRELCQLKVSEIDEL
jgi:hypothetical protein